MNQQSSQENENPIMSEHFQQSKNGGQSGKFFRFGLRTTIMIWFLGISLIPLVFVSLVGFNNAIHSRLDDFTKHLMVVSVQGQQHLNGHFQAMEDGLKQEAWSPQTRAMILALNSEPSQGAPSWEGGRHLKLFQMKSGAEDILLTDGLGKVLFSTDSGENRGLDLLQDESRDPGLKSKIRLALNSGSTAYSQINRHTFSGNHSFGCQVEPVRGHDGSVLGLLIMELGSDLFSGGWKGQNFTGVEMLSYVVDESGQLMVASSPNIDHFKIDFTPAIPGIHEVKEYTGIDGKTVLGVTQDIYVLGSTYSLVSELPRLEVLAGLKSQGYSLLAVLVLVALLVVLAGILVANRMVDPINQLGGVMRRVADGHEVWNLPVKGPREIGQLTEMFQSMIGKLNDARELNERQYAQKRRHFELTEKLRGENSLEDLSNAVLEYLGEYFGSQLGVFYLVESRDKYRMVANFGLNDSTREMDDVIQGQGLVGQVVAQKKIQVLRGFRDEHLKVETGLVRSYVNNLVVAPIHFGNRVLGVLELGTMEDVDSDKLEFLNLVSETIAVAINSARSRERVHRLLKETWSQSATLSKHQKELRESNRRFELADQYKSEFLANMSHELRTPLNSMLIMSQVLAENRGGNLTGDEVDTAMTINRAGSDLLLLINDILDLSRVEAGKLDIQFTEFDLRPLLNDMEDLFEPLAQKQGLKFHSILDPKLPETMTSDPLRMTQILKNILNNAFKFTENGSVTFRVELSTAEQLPDLDAAEDSSWIVFSIADTGVGMQAETREKIFEAFNQGDGSIGRRYGGSGLGLSISKKLSEMLGGQIQVESLPGEGSTFSLFLAVQPSQKIQDEALEESIVTEKKASGELGLSLEFEKKDAVVSSSLVQEEPKEKFDPGFSWDSRRVLICEDDMRTVFRLSEVLDELGAEMTLAPSWNQGVTEGKADHGFDFAIVSNSMADRPGPNSVSTWKQDCGNPAYPVLTLLSAEDGALCDGADLVGRRPLEKEQFLGLIGQALTRETTELK